MKCKWCNDGTVPAGFNYPAHKCTDCNETGRVLEEVSCPRCWDDEELVENCHECWGQGTIWRVK